MRSVILIRQLVAINFLQLFVGFPQLLFYLFFKLFGTLFFDNIAPRMNAKIPDKHIWKGYFFFSWDLKNKNTCFFYKQHFYQKHQAEILSEIITISSIKRSQKKYKHFKWKTCWVKSVAATKYIHFWEVVLTPVL